MNITRIIEALKPGYTHRTRMDAVASALGLNPNGRGFQEVRSMRTSGPNMSLRSLDPTGLTEWKGEMLIVNPSPVCSLTVAEIIEWAFNARQRLLPLNSSVRGIADFATLSVDVDGLAILYADDTAAVRVPDLKISPENLKDIVDVVNTFTTYMATASTIIGRPQLRLWRHRQGMWRSRPERLKRVASAQVADEK